MTRAIRYSWVLTAALAASAFVNAQTSPRHLSDTSATLCPNEQMPELPGGGGMAAIVAAIQKAVHYPICHLPGNKRGRVYAAFTVSADGLVNNVKILKSLGAGYDEAVLAAIQKLPRFIPGRQNNKPKDCTLSVPITFLVNDSPRP